MTQNFHEIVDRVVADRDLKDMRQVVEKELLHYDILYCLQKNGFLKDITFQGGTSLRMCYGSKRFSEDLDFAGGPDFDRTKATGMADALESHIADRYGLSVQVKCPKEHRLDADERGVAVDKWQVSVITHPGDRSMPRQRIKVEIGNVTAHTREPRQLQANYDILPGGYSGMLVGVETLEEIMADKLVSLPAVRDYVRHRDVWDLLFIKQRASEIRTDLVVEKAREYGIDDYPDRVRDLLDRLPGIVDGKLFRMEMTRFLDPVSRRRFVENPDFRSHLTRELSTLFETVSRDMERGPEAETAEFMI